MSEPRTRTGPIREGFEYQDLYGVAVLIEWLEHPQRFAWVKFEADEFGSLDDVATCTSKSDLVLMQIKHSVSPELPEAEMSLKELLHVPPSENSKRLSLFQKWFLSWRDAIDGGKYKSIRPVLITNRPAARSLLNLTSSDATMGTLRIDVDSVVSLAPEYWEQLLAQAQNAEVDLRHFLSILELRFDSPDILVQRTALQTRCRSLGVYDAGYASLESAAREWAAKRDLPRPGGFIHLDDVRAAVQWTVPKGLDQQFEIPSDFVSVGGPLVRELLDAFTDIYGGVKVIFGSPGAGKSTFLSDLYRKVRGAGIVCIRHHYFLEPKDPDRVSRLTYDRASEAVLHDLLQMLPGALPNKNPTPGELGQILHTSAKSLASQGKTIVLIVDGLDEVIREADIYQLREFLRQILPAGQGLWLLLGTRPLNEQGVASLIKRETLPEDWIEVPRFGYEECRRLLQSNSEDIEIHDNQIDEFTSRFFERTQGHPLHARYTVEALKQMCKGGFAIPSDNDRVPAYGTGLSDFYGRLWDTLPYEAKEVANLLALAAFALTAQHIVEIIAIRSGNTSSLLRAIDALKPYIKARTQYVELFHSSFQEFVRNTNEYVSTKTVLLSQVGEWLADKAPEPLRWGHLNRIRYFQGDAAPLLRTVNRQWAISAFADARPIEEIIDQVDWAAHISMEQKCFGAAFVFDQLSEYIQQSRQFNIDLWDRIDTLARRLTHGTSFDLIHAYQELTLRSANFLKEVGFDLSKSGQSEILKSVLRELNERMARKSEHPGEIPGNEWWSNAGVLVTLAALTRFPVSDVVKWAVNFRESGRSADLLERYAETLMDTKQITSLRQLATSPILQPFEKDALESAAYRVATIKGEIRIDDIITNRQATIWSKLHSALTAPENVAMPSELPTVKDLPVTAREYVSEERRSIADRFERVYLESLLLAIQGRSEELEVWRRELVRTIWSHEASLVLTDLAVANAADIKDRNRNAVNLFALTELSTVLFPEDRDQWTIWQAFHLTLKRVLAIFINLRFVSTQRKLDRDLISKLQAVKQLSRQDIKDILLSVEPSVLSIEETREFVNTEIAHWDSIVENFPERAEYYMDLAQLLFSIGDFQGSKNLLQIAISNAIGYGYHKDLSIFESVEAIREIYSRGSPLAKPLLSRLVPIAKWAGDFTDGDETKNLLIDAAEVCQIACPEVLHGMYISLSKEEKLYFAEDVFPLLIESLDFKDPIQRALALTSVDSDSREMIKERGRKGDSEAVLVSEALEQFADLPTRADVKSNSSSEPFRRTEEPVDFEAISPTQLSERIESMGAMYEKWSFISNWFRHNIKQDDKRAVYLAVTSHIESEGVRGADGGFLLEMVPYADEFEGAAAGFDLLCSAAIQLYAWSRFFTDRKAIERIWDTLQDRYPERWLDFVYKTRSVSIYGIPLQKLRALTASVGTRFLVRFGGLAQGEDLAEASVRNIENLMGNLELPAVDWFAVARSPLDTLIARLFWISNVVRERAAIALANLLERDSTFALTLSKLTDALATEQLESRVIVLLLPMLRAARAGRTIPIDQLRNALKKPSLGSGEILNEIELANRQNVS